MIIKKQLANTNEDKLLISKKREMFINAYNKDHYKLEELTKKINYDDLNYIAISTDEETEFTKVKDPINFLDDIKTGNITIKEAKNKQEDFNEFLEEIQKTIKNERKR